MTQVHVELSAVRDACREPNWDGFDARPVGEDTVRQARLFLQALSPSIPAPAIGAEPDGALTFEWHHSARRTLSVSIDANGILYYAGLFDECRAIGSAPFREEIPQIMVELIRRVYSCPYTL
jgi:hypothetical protein